MINGTLLIVDDNKSVISALEMMLQYEVDKLITITSPKRMHEILEQNEVDIVLLDMNFQAGINSGNEGLFWMKEILKHDKNISVVMITAYGDVELAVKAIREGAVDFILKPWDNTKLLATINAAWKLRASRQEAQILKKDNQFLRKEIKRSEEKIVLGASPTMINVMNIVRKVAGTDANILITGENGTGKELVAREIHNLSKRSNELMVSVDMGSITETLFESEMFGHVKGAFTDAKDDRTGKFEIAHKGTLFLDEIGNLSSQSQSKLLSALQNRYIVRIGSNRPIPIDIRLICATNCKLPARISEGLFREDLLYRINTIQIEVPPLRDRVDDIPVLAFHFLKIYCEKYNKPGKKISTPALEKLSNYPWPGNIRELRHSIEKAVILSDSSVLNPNDFTFNTSVKGMIENDNTTLEEMEKRLIGESIKKYDNNLSVVASKLGITRQTLYNKLKRYDL
ncbi:MAG: sigma-54-dependent Fis family transcriptional regulator [Bacteroidetes bacterium]|nr:MAG: sigma-54-dependent Fis family transcriptional regulator [Bacteroidota bacterium]